MKTNSVKYSYFPLQRILNQHPNASKPGFVDISFEFLLNGNGNENISDEVMIDNSRLHATPCSITINDNEIVSKLDFSLIIQDQLNKNLLLYTIDASLKLFNLHTIEKIVQQFYSMLEQIFASIDDHLDKPRCQLALILVDERALIKFINNTEVLFHSANFIHHEFVNQIMKYSQKLSVELDEQSLTYSEFLYCVQLLSLYLLNNYRIFPDDNVYQSVERSLSMLIAVMAIEMVGGVVYGPLSAQDPSHRLHALVQQTQSLLVLVHY